MTLYLNQPAEIFFDIGIDWADTTLVILNYRKPDGTEGVFSPVVESGDQVKYILLQNELDQAGQWALWSTVTTADGDFPGNPFFLTCKEEGNNPVNKDCIKAFLEITTTTQDARIEAMIPVLIEQYLCIRKKPWDLDDEGNPVYPAGICAVIAQMYDYQYKNKEDGAGLASERIGSYNYTLKDDGKGLLGYPSLITSQITRWLTGK